MCRGMTGRRGRGLGSFDSSVDKELKWEISIMMIHH